MKCSSLLASKTKAKRIQISGGIETATQEAAVTQTAVVSEEKPSLSQIMVITYTRLAPHIRVKLDNVAKAHGVSTSKYLRNLVIKDLEKYNLLIIKMPDGKDRLLAEPMGIPGMQRFRER